MALQKQTISLPFTKGLDTKTDARLSEKPSRMEHSIFTTGDLNKHNGRKALTASIDTGGSQTTGEALFPFGSELVRINGGTTYSLGPTTWLTQSGGSHYCTLASKTLLNTAAGAATFDFAVCNGVGVLAWQGTGGLHVTVLDMASNAIYQTGAAAMASSGLGGQPRCCVLGNKVLILWGDLSTGNIFSTVINTLSPSTSPTATTIRTDYAVTAATFDAVTYNASLAVLVYPSNTTDLKIVGVDSSGAVTTSPAVTTVLSLTAANGLEAGLLVQRDTAGSIYIVYGDKAARATKYIVRSSTFASVLGATNIVTTGNWSGTTAEFYQGVSFEATANSITLVLANAYPNTSIFLGTAVINSAGVGTAFSELPSTSGMTLQGDAVSYDGTFVYAAVNADFNGAGFSADVSGLQSSAFVVDASGKTVARGLDYASVQSVGAGTLRVARGYSSSGVAYFPAHGLESAAFSSATTSNVVRISTFNVTLLSITKTSPASLPIQQVGGTLYLGGGYPRTYDGLQVAESGFALFPDLVFIDDLGGGGALSAGTYGYKLVYAWVNAQGELVRGPPSVTYSIVLAASHSTRLRVAAMPLSMRDLLPAGATVYIEAYRTQANGTVYNRTTTTLTFNATTFSALTSGGVAITDNNADTAVAVGELLYTTGGILDWECPPAYSASCTHQGRLVVLPSEEPYAFMPSSTWQTGQQLRFSSFTKAYVPADTGPLVGCASMDGALLLFTTEAAYLTRGDGPDNLGNNTYPPVQRVVGVDTGPLLGSPVVTTPMGIVYQSSKGLTLVDRSLNQQFIGADVEAYTTGPWLLRSIVVHSRLQQIHFQVDDGRDVVGAQMGTLVPSQGGWRLVYDYFFQQWSVDPSWGAQDACVLKGLYTQVRSDGACLQETIGQYLDNGSAYTSAIETPWIKLGGVQGFQRLYYMSLLGTYGSAFTLALDVAYSYASTEPTVPVYDSADSTTFDMGSANVFTQGGQFTIRHHLGKKCSAVKFRIRDLSIGGNGQGIGLTSLDLEYGIKGGVFKLPATQTM